jgi:hypothetical protein
VRPASRTSTESSNPHRCGRKPGTVQTLRMDQFIGGRTDRKTGRHTLAKQLQVWVASTAAAPLSEVKACATRMRVESLVKRFTTPTVLGAVRPGPRKIGNDNDVANNHS